MFKSFEYLAKHPLRPAGPLPHKGGEGSPQTSASIRPKQIDWVKLPSLWEEAFLRDTISPASFRKDGRQASEGLQP
jgi:hypothetical protein